MLARAIEILRTALGVGCVGSAAPALCRAQPSMAPVWNAALAAVAAEHAPERFEAFARRIARAPDALTRFALAALQVEEDARPLSIVTLSGSRSVLAIVEAIRRRRPVAVACSESRPALEGRRLAERLLQANVPVSLFTDAAIAHALTGADAVLVGADAVGPRAFLNKSGTRMLAAAAAAQGVPAYVAATRDKFTSATLWERLRMRDGHPDEVWEAPPAGITVRNPYFEATTLDLIASVISDVGVLGAAVVAQVCESMEDCPLTFAL